MIKKRILGSISNLRSQELLLIRYVVRVIRFLLKILRMYWLELVVNRLLESRHPGLRIGLGTVIEGVSPFWSKATMAKTFQIDGSVKIDKRCHIRIPIGSKLILSDGVYILEGCLIDVGSQIGSVIHIGKSTTVERFCVLGGNIQLGQEILIAPKVFMGSNEHFFDDISNMSIRKAELEHFPDQIKTSIIIENYSWIGVNSVIVGDIKMGVKTIVGANSFVNQSFPNGCQVIAGSPARLIRNLETTS